jgi:hypothetical protein
VSGSNRFGLSIWGYAVVFGVFGYGAGVVSTGSSAKGALVGLLAAVAVIALVVAVQVRGSR